MTMQLTREQVRRMTAAPSVSVNVYRIGATVRGRDKWAEIEVERGATAQATENAAYRVACRKLGVDIGDPTLSVRYRITRRVSR